MKLSLKTIYKACMTRIVRILPHITIVLSAMFITFWILDIYNPMMNFLDSDISKVLLLIFAISALLTSILTVFLDRKSDQIDKKE